MTAPFMHDGSLSRADQPCGDGIESRTAMADRQSNASESAAAGAEVTIINRNQLPEMVHLRMGLFLALLTFDSLLNLACPWTHGIQRHFGLFHSALPKQGQCAQTAGGARAPTIP
jgi:hypothetical protein